MIFKLLIVDDEATMRKGIANFMNWEAMDCEVAGTACDGLEAMEFIKENPVDIVITDIKMPEADGLDLAKFLFENYPDIRVILLTGYADFEYAQSAIRYNVSAFLLKPTNKKDLFEEVQTAQKQILASRKNSIAAKEEAAFLKDQLLQELTSLPFTPGFSQRLHQFHLDLSHYFIAAFQLIPAGEDISFLKKIIIKEERGAYCFRYDSLIIAVYFEDKYSQDVPVHIINNCNEIAEIVGTIDSRQTSVGISRCHCDAPDFHTAVSEAIYALALTFYTEGHTALFSDAPDQGIHDLTAENSLDLYQLENSFNSFSFEDASATVGSLISKCKTNFVHAVDAKNICSQIYYICCRVLIKKDLTAPSPEFLSEIYRALDIFALEDTIGRLMKDTKASLLKTMHVPNRIVEHTIRYINDNLPENLSLEVLAEHLHISPSHLSRTFKKSCEESLTEYINKTRVEKAKEYLLSGDLLAYEAAELVGYHDPAYFSSIFKKYTGVSPTDYRQNIFRNEKSDNKRDVDAAE